MSTLARACPHPRTRRPPPRRAGMSPARRVRARPRRRAVRRRRRRRRGSSTTTTTYHISAVLHLVQADRDIRGYLTMTATAAPDTGLTVRSFRAIGTTATVVVQDPDQADVAERVLARALDEIDLACSRFREDSELAMLHAEAGRTVRVSSLLFEALEVACRVAARTGGAVDPTVGNAICALGYDADLDEVRARRPLPPGPSARCPATGTCSSNSRTRTVRIPRGVRLDLGFERQGAGGGPRRGADRPRARRWSAGQPGW